MNITPTPIGIIGCGNISSIYLESDRKFSNITITKVADLDMERAIAQATKYDKQAVSVDELLADPSVEIIINLTVPRAHGPVALSALNAGKSVYDEKPLATEREDAQTMLALAKSRGLRVGGAPDTFLGGGLQTCRALIDAGAIGRPVTAFAQMLSAGMESWHPNPEFFFKPGGGPVQLKRKGAKEWEDVAIKHRWVENSRGIGVAEMAEAIRDGRPHRASGELTYHVLDVMHAFHDSAREGKRIAMASTCERPAPLPVNWP